MRHNAFRLRRWLSDRMGTRERHGLKAKTIYALLIFLVSFSVKSLHATDLAPLMHTNGQLHSSMAGEYLRESKSILEGHGVLVPDNKEPEDTSLLVHGPGYAIFMSAVYALLGGSYFTIQLAQNLLNSVAPVLVFLIAGTLLGRRVAVVSGLISAISHHFGYYSNVILPDSLCALPILAAVYILVAARRRIRPAWAYALAGLMIGLSIWLRPNALLMGPVLALMVTAGSVCWRQAARRAWILALVPFIAITPITIRNYLVYKEFIPVSANMGVLLWQGVAEARGEQIDDVIVAKQEAELYNNPSYGETWARPDGIKRDRDRTRKSLAVIASRPLWYAGAMVERMGEMLKYSAGAPLISRADDTKLKEAGEVFQEIKRNNFTPAPSDIAADDWLPVVGEKLSWLRPVFRPLQRVVKETAQSFILIGALLTLILSVRRSLYVLMVPAYYLLVQSVMHTEFRYTLPIHYFLFIFAAATWVVLGTVAWRRSTQALRSLRVLAYFA